MSSFSLVLVEESVEVEIPGDLTGVIELLDQEVRWFSCDGHEFQITPTRTELGTRWELSINLINSVRRDLPRYPVGRIELEKLDGEMVIFRIPPRDRQDPSESSQFDPLGHYLGSFISQMLNLFQDRNLISLPGVLPTV